MRIRPAATLSVIVAVLAGLVLAGGLAAPAAAKGKPCPVRVQDDWLDDGVINGKYPVHCLQQALANVPEDLRDYSSAADDIYAALQAQIAQRNTRSPQSLSGSAKGKAVPRGIGGADQPSQSAYRRAIDNLGTSNADALPIPLLVLASLGGALLAAAAGMTATKRIRALRARRGPPSD